MFGTKKELLEIKTELDKIKNQLIIPKSNSEEISGNEKELKKWETGKISDKEKLMAAYALNLCTVSVSQIVDYSDLVILEQEYEAILNNLNLENFPKDEALLNILKQILDTVTFFRIQEGDKKFIDREYQQKMKNAIWSAVPNIGLIVAGGNPITMAISLASQVGIGYMNYRKEKAKNQLEYEKQKWQLQRSAIEQFNALRRELFTTAWRLADKYNFKDEYRLTEKQITQYNDILMDNNLFRKYERLCAIKENFEAYPPFWYYLGNAANAVVQKYFISNDVKKDILEKAQLAGVYEDEIVKIYQNEETYIKYKKLALEYFDQYWKVNNLPLLRKDDIAVSCALEHIDLLVQDGIEVNKERINELLGIAIKNAGNSWDIIQLCTMNYLRLGNFEEAKKHLRILVTEDYNAPFNAQILSQRYVREAIEKKDEMYNYPEYATLCRFVNSSYLYPWPKDFDNIKKMEDDFYKYQKAILKWKYASVVIKLIEKYTVLLNRQTQCPADDYEKEYTDSYFLDTVEKIKIRYYDFKRNQAQVNRDEYVYIYIDVLEKFVSAVKKVPLFEPVEEDEINLNPEDKSIFKFFYPNQCTRVIEKPIEDQFDQRIQFYTLVKEFVKSMVEEIKKIDNIANIEINEKESELVDLCKNENIQLPEIPISQKEEKSKEETTSYFSIKDIYGEDANKIRNEKARRDNQLKIIRNVTLAEGNKLNFLIQGDEDFKKYVRTNLPNELEALRKQNEILAILDDTTFSNCDLVFDKDMIHVIKKKKYECGCNYSEIKFIDNSREEKVFIIDDFRYSNKKLDFEKFKELIDKLKEGSVVNTKFSGNSYPLLRKIKIESERFLKESPIES